MATEKLLQRLDVNIERRIKPHMARYRLKNEIGYVSRFAPMRIEPFLELRDFTRALNLNVQLYILGQARHRKIA